MTVVEAALKYLGVKESPANSNNVIFNTWMYGKDVHDGFPNKDDKYPWCCTFVSKVYFDASKPLGNIGYPKGYVGCPYAIKHLSAWGRIVTVPKEDDIVFFDWNGDGKFDHTGIFMKDLGNGLFRSIEGNTSLSDNSNGGEVMVRSDRKFKNAIFVRPFVLEPKI